MDHKELGEPFKNFTFKFVEPHEYEAVLQVLEDYLYAAAEPMGFKPEFADDWNNFFRALLGKGHNLSFMAIDSETGQIAAVRIVDLCRKDEEHKPPAFRHKPAIDFHNVRVELCKDANLYEKYDIREYAEMVGLCVANKYRQNGLATETYARCLNFLRKRGFKIVKCGFMSPYSRRAGCKHGYQEFTRGKFSELRDKDGNVLNPNAEPEAFMCFGVFHLVN